jgi:hypothetical protein
MQVNSAQDYLTAQKRTIVAATFASRPAPLHRRTNDIYLSILANKSTQYNKPNYPQVLSLAAGSRPGFAYVTPGVRPTISSCVNCPTVAVSNALPGSLV